MFSHTARWVGCSSTSSEVLSQLHKIHSFEQLVGCVRLVIFYLLTIVLFPTGFAKDTSRIQKRSVIMVT